MNKAMNVLSLFDGMSAGQIALEKAGIKVDKYYASDIDKYAISVTQKNFPNTIQLGDVRTLEIPKEIDLLIGGSPCQGFSFAGKQLNFDDPRSSLFFDYVRILKEVKPTYFLLENVPMKQEFKDIISSYLGVEPILINSSLLSAQSRKRWYWTNIPNIHQPVDKGIVLSDILEEKVDEKYYINTERAIEICDLEAKKGKIAYIGTGSQGFRIYSIHDKSVTLCGSSGGMGGKTGLYWIPCMSVDRTKKSQNGIRFKPSNSKFYTLTSKERHGVLVNGQIRRLTPLECERLQTVPEGFTAEGINGKISDSQRYKLLGNSWTVDVISHIFETMKRKSDAPLDVIIPSHATT
jgi:DNA-cytosine methyltransferase